MHKWIATIKKLEWISYIWLIYLPFTIGGYLPAKSNIDWFWLGMTVLFLITYILVVEISRWRFITMPLELVIAGMFSLIVFNNFLLIFPGWQVSSILARRPKKYFYWFTIFYFLFLLGGFLRFNSYHQIVLNFNNTDIIGLLFPAISPFVAYSISKSVFRQQQLHQTNRRLQSIIQRNERERIARDLHDTLGQSFSMITIKTELTKKLLQRNLEKAVIELNDIEQTSRQNLQMVRKIVNDLHQQSISETLLAQSENLAKLDIVLTTTGEEAALKWPTTIQARFSAAMTEALTNVIRHAHASSVQITFKIAEEEYRVAVQDNGTGSTFKRIGSNGIKGMRARMLEGNGHFEIEQNRNGTLVTLRLPEE